MEASAKAITELLRQGEFKEITSKFNSEMKAAMSADRLEASWAHIMIHLGPFKNIRVAKKDPEFDRVDVRCAFENGPMIIRIAFDPAGKIAGRSVDAACRRTEKDSQICGRFGARLQPAWFSLTCRGTNPTA